jgi:hypothetical protein
MKTKFYTLAIAHNDGPAAEIFSSERAALERRLELSEISDSARERLLHLFDARRRRAYEEALDQLESEVNVVCSIEKHEFGSGGLF